MTHGIRQRFARGIVWNLLSAASAQGSTFLVNIALARMLGRAEFGKYALVLGSVQNVALLAALALGYTATRYLAELRHTDPARAGRILGFCLSGTIVSAGLVSLLLALFAPLIATHFLEDPSVTWMLRIAAATAFFIILSGVCVGALAGLEAYPRLGRTNAIAGVLFVALCLGGAAQWGLDGAVVGLLASSFVQLLLMARALQQETRAQKIAVDYSKPGDSIGILRRFALPSALAGLSVATAVWFGQLLLARSEGGYVELAGYVAAFNLMSIVLFLPSLSNTVGSTVLNSLRSDRSEHDYRHAFWFNWRVTLVLVLAGAILLIVLRTLLLSVYGGSFTASGAVLLLLAIGSLPEALTTACAQLVQTRERMWDAVTHFVLPRDIVFVGLALYLVPVDGARGLATAFLVSRTVAFLSAILLVQQLFRREERVAVQP